MAEQVHDNEGEAFTGVRLPSQFVPEHYRLFLKPDLKHFTFEGTVKITFKKPQKASRITLHALELDIFEGRANLKQPKVEGLDGSLKKVIYNSDNGTATLIFDNQAGEAGEICSIFLKFRGIINDKLRGFYRTSFKSENQTVYFTVTQFAATDARRCFPCWDEPSFKATFALTLVYSDKADHKLVPLSNMPIVSLSHGDHEAERVAVFDETPVMSTYLLAFALGPFEYIEKVGSKPLIRVYTIPGKKEQGRFALEVASKSLTFFEEYFGIPYPLAKMDLIAVPDFSYLAMENWGLIAYRETALLVDLENTSTTFKQQAALTISHEISHQWFGNLVTMEWWTHLWLNEGFARFMEHLCVDHIFPEYKIWSHFASVVYSKVMQLDSLHSSHPIEVPVESSSEIDEIFDMISYSKGASIISMLYHYIGDKYFRKGLKDYLTKFAYKNTVTEDLWETFGAVSKKPVREIMSGWTSQTGYPWLSVSFSPMEGGSSKLTLTQRKFTADGKLSRDEETILWMIPVSVTSYIHNESGPESVYVASEIISRKEDSLNLPLEPSSGRFYKLNPGHVGFYRIAYPDDLSAKLQQAILDKTLSPIDRLGVQDDYFAMSQAGIVSTVGLLKLFEAYKAENDYYVWNSISSSMGNLCILLSNTDYLDKFKLFGIRLYSKIFKLITWTPKLNESHTDALLRPLIINRLITFGDSTVISEAKGKFRAHIDKTSIIPSDLRGAVFKAISIHGDDESFDQLFELYRSSESIDEKIRVLSALASTIEGPRLDRVVDLTLSDEVRKQDKATFAFPCLGLANPLAAWRILKENKDTFREAFGTSSLIRSLVKGCTGNFASEQMAVEIDEFFKANRFAGAERVVQQSLENIRTNEAWLERDSDAIRTFLSSQ